MFGPSAVQLRIVNRLRWLVKEEEMAAGLAQVLGAPALGIGTRSLHPAKSLTDPYQASTYPLYQTATFYQPSATEGGPYDYTRSGNPTRTALEEQLAALEARPCALKP